MNGRYDVVVIGAGIGGLVCGCYLADSGLRVMIAEQHDIPGGYCTSFERGGYRFDVGVHYLGGLKKGVIRRILDELDIDSKIRFSRFDPADEIIFPGNKVYVRADVAGTIEEFRKNARDEKACVDRFFRLLLEEDFLSIYGKLKDLTFKQLLDAYFKDDVSKAPFNILMGNIGAGAADVSALTAASFFREFILDPGYYPQGGMQTVPDTLADRFRSLKGELALSEKVTASETEGGAVRGVRMERGTVSADHVVSNADATATFRCLLDVKPTRESETVGMLRASSSAFALYLGLNPEASGPSGGPASIWFSDSCRAEGCLSGPGDGFPDKDVSCGMICFPSLHDPSLATGKSTVQVFTNVQHKPLNFWREHKEAAMEKLLRAAKRFVPRLGGDGAVALEVGASPATFERYTGNRHGAIYGWVSTPDELRKHRLGQKTSIKGLYMAGHWCASGIGEGGVSGVASLGRSAARLILEEMGKGWRFPRHLL